MLLVILAGLWSLCAASISFQQAPTISQSTSSSLPSRYSLSSCYLCLSLVSTSPVPALLPQPQQLSLSPSLTTAHEGQADRSGQHGSRTLSLVPEERQREQALLLSTTQLSSRQLCTVVHYCALCSTMTYICTAVTHLLISRLPEFFSRPTPIG